ncbi:MAG: hypothetical protein NDI70_10860 [Pseudomonas sagittaria]|uniref:hypothetical protein n=1 Tax=Geopseudomonas sagittaria TaxID=1135990 RepID=UPI001587ACAE|nr:hypothetical protein [Pseudomonas sagittaria]MCM2331787.1 hypothetical protein [Pseudomonas sagittaria]
MRLVLHRSGDRLRLVGGRLESMINATSAGRIGVPDKPAASTIFWSTERAP